MRLMKVFRIAALPVFTAIWIALSFFISLIIAFAKSDVQNLPYISFTAIHLPQRSIFAQMVNIGAVLLGLTAYFRYLLIRKRFENLEIVNFIALVFGLASAFGLSIVANFQAKVIHIPHCIGAFLAFISGIIYCPLQTYITWKQKKKHCMFFFRLIITILLVITFIMFVIAKSYYNTNKYEGSKHNEHQAVYLVSTSTEWLLAAFILLFIGSYAYEFRHVKISGLEVIDSQSSSSNEQSEHSSIDGAEIPMQTNT